MKHIVVEGPDGAGKTTFIEKLSEAFSMPVHAKASDSVAGPHPELWRWVDEDMPTLQQRHGMTTSFIYDRHPVISEPIYSRWARKETAQLGFTDSSGFLKAIRESMYVHCVVVWCLPSLETVAMNVMASQGNQMPGVVSGIAKVHEAYWGAYGRWRGPRLRYDYTQHDLSRILTQLKELINE